MYDEPVTSNFDTDYYFKAICGGILFLCLTGYGFYHCLLGNLATPVSAYITTLILLGASWVYYYFFSKSWKRIIVNATEIIVHDVIFKKQVTIAYADITHIGTYRTRGRTRSSFLSQNFVIEFADDDSISFDEAWYENYDKLTIAIYFHKFGPGHGRERYLQRHQR